MKWQSNGDNDTFYIWHLVYLFINQSELTLLLSNNYSLDTIDIKTIVKVYNVNVCMESINVVWRTWYSVNIRIIVVKRNEVLIRTSTNVTET